MLRLRVRTMVTAQMVLSIWQIGYTTFAPGLDLPQTTIRYTLLYASGLYTVYHNRRNHHPAHARAEDDVALPLFLSSCIIRVSPSFTC